MDEIKRENRVKSVKEKKYRIFNNLRIERVASPFRLLKWNFICNFKKSKYLVSS